MLYDAKARLLHTHINSYAYRRGADVSLAHMFLGMLVEKRRNWGEPLFLLQIDILQGVLWVAVAGAEAETRSQRSLADHALPVGGRWQGHLVLRRGSNTSSCAGGGLQGTIEMPILWEPVADEVLDPLAARWARGRYCILVPKVVVGMDREDT